MRLLVDTNLWCDFFTVGQPVLLAALDQNRVLMHPLIVGELAMGNLPNRTRTIRDLQSLPHSDAATSQECLDLMEGRRLYSRGLQWNDLQLLASVLLTPDALLWTRDRRLKAVAGEFGVAFSPQAG